MGTAVLPSGGIPATKNLPVLIEATAAQKGRSGYRKGEVLGPKQQSRGRGRPCTRLAWLQSLAPHEVDCTVPGAIPKRRARVAPQQNKTQQNKASAGKVVAVLLNITSAAVNQDI